MLWEDQRLNESPSGRALCKRCNGAIAKGAWRVTVTRTVMSAEIEQHYHALCAVDVNVYAVRRALAETREDFAGREAIATLVNERTAGRDDRGELERGAVETEVERARDPSGRPRVRVYLAGNAMSSGSKFRWALESVARSSAWASPLREYVFIEQRTDVAEVARDPSQPIVGAVLAVIEGKKLIAGQRDKVLAWHRAGLPTPALLVFATGKEPVSDDEVLRFREVLSACGYNGDEASVLTGFAFDKEMFDRLAATLDETLTLDVAAKDANAPQTKISVARAHLESERGAALLRSLDDLWNIRRKLSREERASLDAVAAGALAYRECEARALWLLREAEAPDTGAVHRWLAALLASSRAIGDGFECAVEILSKHDAEGLKSALKTAHDAKGGARRKALIAEALTSATRAAMRAAKRKKRASLGARRALQQW